MTRLTTDCSFLSRIDRYQPDGCATGACAVVRFAQMQFSQWPSGGAKDPSYTLCLSISKRLHTQGLASFLYFFFTKTNNQINEILMMSSWIKKNILEIHRIPYKFKILFRASIFMLAPIDSYQYYCPQCCPLPGRGRAKSEVWLLQMAATLHRLPN